MKAEALKGRKPDFTHKAHHNQLFSAFALSGLSRLIRLIHRALPYVNAGAPSGRLNIILNTLRKICAKYYIIEQGKLIFKNR